MSQGLKLLEGEGRLYGALSGLGAESSKRRKKRDV